MWAGQEGTRADGGRFARLGDGPPVGFMVGGVWEELLGGDQETGGSWVTEWMVNGWVVCGAGGGWMAGCVNGGIAEGFAD